MPILCPWSKASHGPARLLERDGATRPRPPHPPAAVARGTEESGVPRERGELSVLWAAAGPDAPSCPAALRRLVVRRGFARVLRRPTTSRLLRRGAPSGRNRAVVGDGVGGLPSGRLQWRLPPRRRPASEPLGPSLPCCGKRIPLRSRYRLPQTLRRDHPDRATFPTGRRSHHPSSGGLNLHRYLTGGLVAYPPPATLRPSGGVGSRREAMSITRSQAAIPDGVHDLTADCGT